MTISPEIAAVVGEIDFDPDALHEKYLYERDKRLREDGIGQYVEVKGDFTHYIDDPYVEPGFTRAPVFDHVEIAIIGGGFGGLLMGARLREAGFDKIRMVESAGDFGGTWYWNRYPGAMCDVESYCYLPLLEELNYIPKHKYSFAPEILEHSRAIGRHYRLYDDALLQTAVTELRWDEKGASWVITTSRGDRFTAQYVAMANGPLSRPKLPGIPGINEFKGHTFHTSRWDYRYTGGSSEGGLTGLADKRVGIIGTGATAIQCVPHLGEWAKELYVFQRTPSSVDVRNNAETDPAWAASLHAGLAAAAAGQLQHPRRRRRPGRGHGPRRLDRHLPQPDRHGGEGDRPQAWAPADQRRAGRGDADRRLPQDEPGARAGGRDRQGPGDRGQAQALVPPVLQAAVLPRRISADLQPAERPRWSTPTARASRG